MRIHEASFFSITCWHYTNSGIFFTRPVSDERQNSFKVSIMGGNSSPTTSPRRSGGVIPPKSDSTAADQEQKRGGRSKQNGGQAPNIQKVIDSCRTNFARELKKTFELDVLSDDEVLKCNGEVDSASAPVRTRSAASLSPLGPATRSSSGGLVRSLQGGDDGTMTLSDENSRRLARQLWANCEKVSGDNFKTAAAAVDGEEAVHNGRMSRSRYSTKCKLKVTLIP